MKMPTSSILHVCNCGTPLKSNEKYCDKCRVIGYVKVKVKSQLRWLKETGKDATHYRSINPEFRESCKLRDFVRYHADEIEVGAIL
jgi:hypothetical protein